MFGIGNFTAIINAPESAILSVSSVRKTPVVVTDENGEDAIAIRPMMNIQPVSYTHLLLRVLQNREVRRIGASKALRIDVRVITATNRDLEQLVDSKVFREDLFYRINVFRINICLLYTSVHRPHIGVPTA